MSCFRKRTIKIAAIKGKDKRRPKPNGVVRKARRKRKRI